MIDQLQKPTIIDDVTDRITSVERSRLMSRIKGRDTKPELVVRSALHRAGFRFSLHKKILAGRPDIVLPKWKVAIFVHGCFWHGHNCPRAKLPQTNSEFWKAKISANKLRDATNVKKLNDGGWQVFTIWTCKLNSDLSQTSEALCSMRNHLLIELTK